MLAQRTEREYRFYVRRWQANGQPDPETWLKTLTSDHARRNARAALVWWYRTELGVTLKLAPVPVTRKIPDAFTELQLHRVLQAARIIHCRAAPVLELLYATGARVSEATGIALEDVTTTHVLLRQTKRSARSGARIERAIPLSPRSRSAVMELRSLPAGRVNNLVGVRAHTVQDWCRVLSRGADIRVHPHKFRATFCTHLLQRGVPVHEVQRLMGHSDIATTMRYAAVTDERLALAVALL